MQKYVVGLTGGIASGKTQVEKYFTQLGVESIDADVVARQIVIPGSTALAQIENHFGSDFILKNGSLNRKKLRQTIFESEQEKAWLEQLTHPLIRQQMLSQLESVHSSYALLVAPLLFENKLQQFVNRSLVVDTSLELQLQRTVERDKCTSDQAKSIIGAQLSREERLKQADDIIVNDTTVGELKEQVQLLHSKYLKLSRSHA